jgi:Fe2+ or Zn2+ uptake regulation protein
VHSGKPLRLTQQRQALLDALSSQPWHPTADELYALVRKSMPRISLGTVYRNLDWLATRGLIQQLDTGGHQKRYDRAPERHYHVRCLVCGRLDDVTVGSDQDLRSLVQDSGDYALSGYLLEFMGVCPSCQNHDRKENKNGKFEGYQD